MRQSLDGHGTFTLRRLGLACLAAAALAFGVQPAFGQATAPAGEIPVPPLPAGSQPAPIIHVDSIEHDFGDQWVGPELEHTFTLSNRGSVPLEIRGTRADCSGCTTVGEYSRTIEPGQTSKLPVKLRTVGLNGRVGKNVTVYSNDPVTKELTLKLLGTYKKRVDVQPVAVSFGTLVTTLPMTKVIKITNNTDKPLQLKLQPVPSDRLKFELKETVPGKAFDLNVTTVIPYQPGLLQATAVLETNFEEEKLIRVAASGRVPDRLDLYPPTANYVRPPQTMAGQTGGTLFFWLSNYGPSLVNITQATVDDPAIKVNVETRSPGKAYQIRLDIPLNVTIPPTGRVLTVTTDDPEKPTLQSKIVAPAPPPQLAQAAGQATRPSPQTPRVRPAELLVGKPVPPFQLTTFESRPVKPEEFGGKLTVLNFVSPACGFCKRQIPDLEKIRANYQDKGVRFVNVVNMNPSGRKLYTDAEVTEFMKGLGSQLEVAADVQSVAGSALRVDGYPTCVVVDKDAKVAAVNIGSNKVQLVPAQLDALLAGKSLPATTQPH